MTTANPNAATETAPGGGSAPVEEPVPENPPREEPAPIDPVPSPQTPPGMA